MGLYRQPRQFCETSAEVPNYVMLSVRLCGNLGLQKLYFDVSPNVLVIGRNDGPYISN